MQPSPAYRPRLRPAGFLPQAVGLSHLVVPEAAISGATGRRPARDRATAG